VSGIVIASEAKQSSFSFYAAKLDCFVAMLLAMTAAASVDCGTRD
jgi:hypothetical protein